MAGQDKPSEWRSDMVDVSGMSLSQLRELSEGDDSAFARSLRRLADASADPDEPIAGFNSAL